MKKIVAILSLVVLAFSGAQPAMSVPVASTTSNYAPLQNVKSPRIVVLPNGTKAMTWFERGMPATFKVMSAVVSPLGAISTPKVIASYSVTADLDPEIESAITLSPSGRLTLVFAAALLKENFVREHHLYATNSTNGIDWTQPIDITSSFIPNGHPSSGFMHPRLATNASGATVLAYWRAGLSVNENALEVVTTTDGVNWTAKREVTRIYGFFTPSPRIVSSGDTVVIAFLAAKPFSSFVYFMATDALATDWSELALIHDLRGTSPRGFAIAAYGSTVTAIWSDQGANEKPIYYSNLTTTPNRVWSRPVQLTFAGFGYKSFNQDNILVEPGGKLKLVWIDLEADSVGGPDYLWSVTFTAGVPNIPYKHPYSIGKEGDPFARFTLEKIALKQGGGWYFVTKRDDRKGDVWLGEVAASGARTVTNLNIPLATDVGIVSNSNGTITVPYVLTEPDGPSVLKIATVKNYNAPILANTLTVSGKYLVSKAVTVTTPKWKSEGPVTKVSYQWYACKAAVTKIQSAIPTGCVVVKGATKQNFVPTKAQSAKYLTVAVTATNPAGSTRVVALAKTRVK